MPRAKKPPKDMEKPTPDMPKVDGENVENKENAPVKSEKKKMGRPTVVTNDVLHSLKQAFAIGCTDIEACAYAGISEKTLYNYINEHPEFLQTKEELKQTPILKAKKMVFDNIEKNIGVAQWLLEKKCRKEFGNAMDIDISMKTKPDLSMLSPEAIKKLAEEAMKELKE